MLRLVRAGCALASIAVLLAPAFWNRFPLIQYDTGGYLARWYEGYLVPSRSTVYGLFLTILQQPDFWLVVVLQSAVTVWMLALTLRALGYGGRPLLLLGTTTALSIFTTLPWLTSILLTDIFAGLAVLALHLLIFADNSLNRFERRALVALVAFSAATHSATFVMVLALLAAAALAWRFFAVGSGRGIWRGAAALALGAALLLAANYIVASRVAWTPGGVALVFGRMLQDGIVARYLAERCPDRRLRLCAHQHELPDDADVFFWGESVFDRLGRFRGLGGEMQTIALESLRAYPAWQAQAAVVAAATQLVRVATGEGVVASAWHTQGMIEQHTPAAAGSMRAARQQRGELDFPAINRLHRPVALASMVMLLAIAFMGMRNARTADLGLLAASAITALLANAVICGVLANPHDRYGARLVWIAPFIVGLAVFRLAREQYGRNREPATAPGLSTAPQTRAIPSGRDEQ
jgi:hypothetical protein